MSFAIVTLRLRPLPRRVSTVPASLGYHRLFRLKPSRVDGHLRWSPQGYLG